MKKLFLYSTILLLMITIACSSKNNDNNNTDLKVNNNLSIKDVFSRITVVPLETTNNSLIKNINKIIFYKGYYYIFDKAQYGVFKFDKNGKFILKLNKRGQGPGEYSLIDDFDINRFNETMELLNPRGFIHIYSLDGQFIEEITLNMDCSAVHYFKNITADLTALYSIFDENRVRVISRKTNKVVSCTHKVPTFLASKTFLNTPRCPFFQNGDKIGMFECFSNDIYTFNNSKLEKEYSWNFGKLNFNIDILERNKTIDYYHSFFKDNQEKFIYCFFYNINGKDKIFTGLRYNGKFTHLIKDKKTGVIQLVQKFKENIGMKSPFAFDKGVIGAVGPTKTHLCLTPDIVSKEDWEKIKNLKIEDNPILINYYY